MVEEGDNGLKKYRVIGIKEHKMQYDFPFNQKKPKDVI